MEFGCIWSKFKNVSLAKPRPQSGELKPKRENVPIVLLNTERNIVEQVVALMVIAFWAKEKRALNALSSQPEFSNVRHSYLRQDGGGNNLELSGLRLGCAGLLQSESLGVSSLVALLGDVVGKGIPIIVTLGLVILPSSSPAAD